MKPIRVAVCIDESKWYEKFLVSLQQYGNPLGIESEVFNIECDDWIHKIADFDAIIWKSHYMGPESSSYFKEKIFFIQHHLKKLTVPNFETIWHFDSKAAQSYIFKNYEIPTPRTVATFDVDDALGLLQQFDMPIVFKKTYGASSSNVVLLKDQFKAAARIKDVFSRQISKKILSDNCSFWSKVSKYLWRYYVDMRLFCTNQRCAYWQEFIPGNKRDLRITAIGDKYAVAFWRNNRPNDFRASGSGNIDYKDSVPEDVVKYCLELNRRFSFDSMAYDIVFYDGSFKVIEMSYSYIDRAIYNADGHFEYNNDHLSFVKGNCWPQELWARWLVERIKQRFIAKFQ
ncbi:hypothetical protein GPEL0_01f0907 [Geoanaerobacter pelophilus]|uniref:ATP-grasp domain-containing protein n=1 Tax=Geoanaerobacter pelophilus TaxID=60036 RepID=A0ABQ0MFZ5_9BACT|nr:hypothetical protein [Geoanaerobacter pelophilus]GAW65834.1 hypothetical protein GPEL0_01f0907 [Geoanaerobacter pelophilus]